jgi:hypothetical protein
VNNPEGPVNQNASIRQPTEESARYALALVDEQRRQAAASLFPGPAPIFAAWGCTYLVGFGALWLTAGHHGAFANWGAALVLAGLGVLASAVSATRVARLGRGLQGPSRRSAVMFSWCWPATLVGVFVFDLGLSRHGVPESALSLLWPASFLLGGAVLFLTAGVLFGDRAQFGLGLWSLAVAAASTFAGSPGNFALLALAGGGGLLATAAIGFLSAHGARVASDDR